MNLTKGEFCQFNLKSRMQLIAQKGTLLLSRKINEVYEVRVFLMYDFYVVVFYNYLQNKAERIEPIKNTQWFIVYFDDLHFEDFSVTNFSKN